MREKRLNSPIISFKRHFEQNRDRDPGWHQPKSNQRYAIWNSEQQKLWNPCFFLKEFIATKTLESSLDTLV